MQILPCPSGGRNRKTPFLAGNGGSRNFRIPCLWAGEDGALYAAADVRWDSEADGGGLAVAFARSRDGGENWEYSFPGFLGDSGGRHDRSASTLMDPMLTVSGNTVFLLCDLFPHGRAMLTGEAGAEKKLSPGNGFDFKFVISLAYSGVAGCFYHSIFYTASYRAFHSVIEQK